MTLLAWFLVIFLTSLVVMLGLSYMIQRGEAELQRVKLLAELDQATANVQLPRAGRLPNQGAQDPAYQLAPVPWELASAAYELGQQRARQDDVSAEVDAMFAEWEAQRGEG